MAAMQCPPIITPSAPSICALPAGVFHSPLPARDRFDPAQRFVCFVRCVCVIAGCERVHDGEQHGSAARRDSAMEPWIRPQGSQPTTTTRITPHTASSYNGLITTLSPYESASRIFSLSCALCHPALYCLSCISPP